MMKRFTPLTLIAAALVAGCGDRPAVTGPDPIGPGLPSASISDGAHSSGNPDFFFLPPLVDEPNGNPAYKDDPFDGSVASQVKVEICKVGGDPNDPSACPVVKAFTSAEITVSLSDETYHVNWDTKEQVLDEQFNYRIQVLIGDVVLGFADADVVDRGNELKNVETGEYIALLDGRKMPIQFRIEQGALCDFDPCATFVLKNSVGGTFFALNRRAGISFPVGALPPGMDEAVVTIQEKPVLPGVPCVDDGAATNVLLQQWEGCFLISITPEIVAGPTTGFQEDVGVGLCAEAGTPENAVAFKWDAGRPLYAGPPFDLQGLMCDGYTGTPSPSTGLIGSLRTGFDLLAGSVARLLGPKSAYAVDGGLGCLILRNSLSNDLSTFFYGQPFTAAAEGYPATPPQVTIDEAVPGLISVKVTTLGIGAHDDDVVIESHDHAHDAEPVANVPVTFTLGDDGGTLSNGQISVNVITDAFGIATLPVDWLVGTDEQLYTLTATGPFVEIDGNRDVTTTSVTFTAEGIGFADLAVTSFDRFPTAPTSLDPINFTIVITNLGPSPAPASTGQFVLTLSTGGTGGGSVGVLSVPAIAGGSSATIGHSLGVQPVGSYTAQFTANTGGQVTESDATNNTSVTDAFSVTPALGSIVGEVRDDFTDDPIAGANVALDGTTLAALTDASGRYVINNVPPGSYSLTASAPGYSTYNNTAVAVSAGQQTQLDIGLDGVPVIGVSPASPLTITAAPGGVTVQQQVTISNTAAGQLQGLDVQFTYPPEIFCDTCQPPAMASVALNTDVSPAVVTITVDVDDTIPVGDYQFSFTVTSTNASNSPVTYPFVVRVVAPIDFDPIDGGGGGSVGTTTP